LHVTQTEAEEQLMQGLTHVAQADPLSNLPSAHLHVGVLI